MGGAWTAASMAEQLSALGVVRGGVLLVHTSFRAVRPVEGGPGGVIDALLEAVGPQGTVVMPSWTAYGDRPFELTTSPTPIDLGIVASGFWKRPDARRSDHPFAFAAVGARADEMVRDPLPLPPHRPESPVGRVHEADGQVLLLGVDHDANTTIHLGEILGGAPYRAPKHITVLEDGAPKRLDYGENDHCCTRFVHVGRWLEEEGLQSTGPVANATARLIRSRDVVRVVSEHVEADPTYFLHDYGVGCEECDEAWDSIPSEP